MKTIHSTCWSFFIVMACAVVASAGQSRADINPAQHYYQAFIVTPDLPQADHDYLFTNEWRGQKLPERFGELVGRYDNQFKLVRQAARDDPRSSRAMQREQDEFIARRNAEFGRPDYDLQKAMRQRLDNLLAVERR